MMDISDDLLKFHIAFCGYYPKATLTEKKIAVIGIGHTNHLIEHFDIGDEWSIKKAKEVWLKDMREHIRQALYFLVAEKRQSLEQRYFDMAVDLCKQTATYQMNPVSFFKCLNESDYAGARQQLLRWIYRTDGQVSLKLVQRTFARYMYFEGLDYESFREKLTHNNIEEFNLKIKELGFELVESHDTRYKLVRLY